MNKKNEHEEIRAQKRNLNVSAKGYKGWVYTDDSNPAQPAVRLASDERRVLDIGLEPLSKTSGVR